MVKLTGGKQASSMLRNISARSIEHISHALVVAGESIQREAQISITTGAVSGKHHVPSKAGSPPANDTGVLADHIETVQINPLKVEVSSNAPYSSALEFGSSKIAERPFLRPALEKKRPEAVELVRRALRAAVDEAKRDGG